ncbi:MAG: guanylate kinase [Gemmataceae bacterium]
MGRGPLIIVSGPSGSGKSTLIRQILAEGAFPLRLAVSATTRTPRPGEQHGVDYYFWTREQFETQLAAGAFLEHATVHGQLYGTPRSEVDGYREKCQGVLLDIDVQGADQVRSMYPEAVTVFVSLSRWEMYEQRLRQRHTESEESLARRLQTAQRELARQGDYQHHILNDQLDEATRAFREVIARQFPPLCTKESSCTTN